MTYVRAALARLKGFFAGADADNDFRAEMQAPLFHILAGPKQEAR